MDNAADEESGDFMRGRWPAMVRLAYALSDGKNVTVAPVTVGNEALFGVPVGQGISPAGWTAYPASGEVVGSETHLVQSP